MASGLFGGRLPVRSLSQSSFFDPQFVCPDCLVRGSVPWLLATHRSLLFPAWLLKGWRGEGRLGRDAWPAVVLMTLALLRWSETGMSRLAAERRAKTDIVWRAAAGLSFLAPTPSERTMRDFEKFLARRHPDCDVPRYTLLLGHIARLCLQRGVVNEPDWVTDSTPMWCYGATLDTIRMLGDGTGITLRAWARATGQSWRLLAKELDLPWVTAKSTKGSFNVADWKDKSERARVITELAAGAIRLVGLIRTNIKTVKPKRRGCLLRHGRTLLKIIEDDLEPGEEGGLVIAQRVMTGRTVSFMDPHAQHGRKSKSKRFNGFKLHILGDAISGLIAAVCVTPAGVHDSEPCPRLLKQAKQLITEIDRLYGDTAYGTGRNRRLVEGLLGVTLIAPPIPAVKSRSGRFGKADFEIDVDADSIICPAGKPSDGQTWHKGNRGMKQRVHWWAAKTCTACPMFDACRTDSNLRRTIKLETYEKEIQASRKSWEDPDVRYEYRRRSPGERLVNSLTRRGGRKAAAWGLRTANLQAHLIAVVVNLRLLAEALAREKPIRAQAA